MIGEEAILRLGLQKDGPRQYDEGFSYDSWSISKNEGELIIINEYDDCGIFLKQECHLNGGMLMGDSPSYENLKSLIGIL